MKTISALSAAPFDSTLERSSRISLRAWRLIAVFMSISVPAVAQVTAADYQRAQALRDRYESAAVFVPDTQTWNFDLLIYPGEDHNAGRGGQYADYGERKRFDFFVRNLLNHNPPEWSATPATASSQR